MDERYVTFDVVANVEKWARDRYSEEACETVATIIRTQNPCLSGQWHAWRAARWIDETIKRVSAIQGESQDISNQQVIETNREIEG